MTQQTKTAIRDEAKAWLAEALLQFGVPSKRLKRLLQNWKHIAIERAKITPSIWYGVLNDDDWTCYLKISPKCPGRNYRNQDKTIPLMEVEHVVPLKRWGTSERKNLRAACSACNAKKSTKLLGEL